MKKATMIIISSVITLCFMITGASAENLLSTVIHKKNNIIGAAVINIQGEKLGEISSLTLDKDTGDITHVVISLRDITDSDKKLARVPLDAVRFINEKNAQLNLSWETLYPGGQAYTFYKD